jgi:hypothetical protein
MKKQNRSKPVQNPLMLSSFNEAGYAAYIGIDWADRKHDISLYECEAQTVEHRVISSQPESIDAWVEELRQRFAGKRSRAALLCRRQRTRAETRTVNLCVVQIRVSGAVPSEPANVVRLIGTPLPPVAPKQIRRMPFC